MKSLNLTKPHLMVVVGIPGAGKTYFAKQFSDTFSAPYIELAELGTFASNDESARGLWDYVLGKLIQTKQTILLEGYGASKLERRQLAAYARTHGYKTLFIWVQTEPSTAQSRASKNSNKQHADGAAFESFDSTEPYLVISGKHTYASQAKNVLKKLAEPRVEKAKQLSVTKRPDLAAQSIPRQQGRITIN